MSIGINYANTGLITQSQNVMSSVNHKLIGVNGTKLKAVTSGTMRNFPRKSLPSCGKKSEMLQIEFF